MVQPVLFETGRCLLKGVYRAYQWIFFHLIYVRWEVPL